MRNWHGVKARSWHRKMRRAFSPLAAVARGYLYICKTKYVGGQDLVSAAVLSYPLMGLTFVPLDGSSQILIWSAMFHVQHRFAGRRCILLSEPRHPTVAFFSGRFLDEWGCTYRLISLNSSSGAVSCRSTIWWARSGEGTGCFGRYKSFQDHTWFAILFRPASNRHGVW